MNTSEARTRKWQPKPNESQELAREKRVTVKVRKQSWITTGEKVIYSIVGIGLIIMSYYFVTYSSTTDSLNREIQSLEKEIELKQIENESLAYEVKELSRPDRIKGIADEYGLKIQNTKVKRAHAFNNEPR